MSTNPGTEARGVKRLFAELKRRRVFRVMAIYGGAAFAVLEAVDLVSSGIPIPGQLRSLLTVLVLAGFPIAVVLSWVFDITPAGLERTDPARSQELEEIVSAPARVRWPIGMLALVSSGLFLFAAWSAASRLGWLEQASPRPAYAVEDPLGSYVVLPFRHLGDSPEERELSAQAATRLARQLRGWESVRVVPDFAIAGALHDLGVESANLPSLEIGLEVGRAQRVGTLIALTTQIEGDSAALEAILYDVGEGIEVRRPIQVTEQLGELDGLVGPVAQEVLELRDRRVPLETLLRESSNPFAHREFQAGLDALYAWLLPEAEVHFREAIAADSTFALPSHYLALTLYWMTARSPERILDIGPEIARLSGRAEKLAAEGGLRPGLAEHVSAFHAFWEGDYEGARRRYDSLLAADSTDVEAWLLLGAVEYKDPWLVRQDDGSLVPRQDLDLARTAFETAARLSPELPLSYGHLFEIDRDVAEAAAFGSCPAFERPAEAAVPPFVSRVARDQLAFCPLPGDSIRWIPSEEFDAMSRRELAEASALMMDRTSSLLDRWVAVRPDQARPHEEVAGFALWQRDLGGCAMSVERADSLTDHARRHLELALAVKADSSASDLVRLAMLRLATGDVPEAERIAARAFEKLGGPEEGSGLRVPPPLSAANLFLATGRPNRAHQVLRPVWDSGTFATLDPENEGEFLMAGAVEPQFGRLRVYGSAGVTGPTLDSLFAALEAVWKEPGFSSRRRAAITQAAVDLGIGPALADSPGTLVSWVAAWRAAGLAIPAVFEGLAEIAADDGSSIDWLDAAMAELEGSERVTETELFLTATLAARSDSQLLAADLFGRVAACPLKLDDIDLGWGLRTRSHFEQAEAYARLGDPAAGEAFGRAAELWTDSEPVLAASARRARDGASARP
jgi:tetratricopeptide (TPR) repeat protein